MLLADFEGCISDPSTAVKEGIRDQAERRCVPMTKSSVFSPLSLSLLKDIHVAISCKHASILATMTEESDSNENKPESHPPRNGSSYHAVL